MAGPADHPSLHDLQPMIRILIRFQNGILLPFSPQYSPRLNEQVGQAFISQLLYTDNGNFSAVFTPEGQFMIDQPPYLYRLCLGFFQV
jgi:hypothetical protein